jgi:hypothetical protein
MTRERVETAVREGIPFLIRMADGAKYKVTESHQVALANSYVVVIGADDNPHILPLLTMTGISYLRPPKRKSA